MTMCGEQMHSGQSTVTVMFVADQWPDTTVKCGSCEASFETTKKHALHCWDSHPWVPKPAQVRREDAYDAAEARAYVDAIRNLGESFPDSEFIVVPKCHEVIETVPDDIVLGYSRGYAVTLTHELSDPVTGVAAVSTSSVAVRQSSWM